MLARVWCCQLSFVERNRPAIELFGRASSELEDRGCQIRVGADKTSSMSSGNRWRENDERDVNVGFQWTLFTGWQSMLRNLQFEVSRRASS